MKSLRAQEVTYTLIAIHGPQGYEHKVDTFFTESAAKQLIRILEADGTTNYYSELRIVKNTKETIHSEEYYRYE